MKGDKKVIVGVTCGDINGIGLEILIKTFLDKTFLNKCVFIVYVPVKIIKDYNKKIKCKNFNYNIVDDPKKALLDSINIVDFQSNDVKLNLGRSKSLAAQVAIDSLDLAVKDLKEKSIDVLVTLPVNKKNISSVRKDFIGHTEYFSLQFNNQENLMLLCSEKLKIATATNHIPVSKISKEITKSLIKRKINILIQTLKQDFLISNPKIAVLSLNPHAGDNGLIGREDNEVIQPVVNSLFQKGHLIHGLFSADGFFGSRSYVNFDAVLAMYHDQALIPFKTISFGEGVNYTSGLPIIRVSPDHGVGYDIAGKGLAKSHSLIYSILLAIQIHSNRELYRNLVTKTKL